MGELVDGTGWLDQHRRVEQPAPQPAPPTAADRQPDPEPTAEVELAGVAAGEESIEDATELDFEPKAPAEPPTELGGAGDTVERTEDALVMRSESRMGKFLLGSAKRIIPWDELLTVEQVSGGMRVRSGKTPVTVAIHRRQQPLIPVFVKAVLEQHAAATGRSAGSGAKLSRAERRDIVTTGFVHLSNSACRSCVTSSPRATSPPRRRSCTS